MPTKNISVVLMLGLVGTLLFIGCAGPAPTAIPIVPTAPPPTLTAQPTSAPTLLPTILPTKLPPTSAPTPTSPAIAAVPTRSALQITGDIDTFFEKYGKLTTFYGVALVTRNGEIVYEKSFGQTILKPTTPITSESKFRLASITKQFTAAAILKLQAQGKLKVTDTLCKYIQPCPNGWEQVTIHHLLTHTAGMPGVDINIRQPHTAAYLATQVEKLPLQSQPGAQFSYSNVGYIMLAALTEQLSGQTYEAFLRDNLLNPLEMKNTGNTIDESQLAGDKLSFDVSNYIGAGDLYSTATDLARWAQALDVWERDPNSEYQAMFQPHVPEDESLKYGYGLEIGELLGHTFIGHGGGAEDYGTFLYRYPADGVTIIILSNNTTGEAVGTIGQGVTKMVFQGN